ncbi:hypothetical protein BKA59DRAFT_449075 [Fusarium tricinctum]|uniref:Uncharacterized protein n=1 Tax=Fusarium tricinctum TaxID=61284 RepID=A0A8K0WHG9_9HYPO|nr:hypothetical protein BKA59DRAFT_449075 [Fusarium tricinctum]
MGRMASIGMQWLVTGGRLSTKSLIFLVCTVEQTESSLRTPIAPAASRVTPVFRTQWHDNPQTTRQNVGETSPSHEQIPRPISPQPPANLGVESQTFREPTTSSV